MMKKNIKARLSASCFALLTAGQSQSHNCDQTEKCHETAGALPAHIPSYSPWDIDIGLANYIEQDRNTGFAFYANGSRAVDEDRINLRAEFDIITGATPNGATPSNVAQTFTMSSGVGSYRVEAGELPADDTHMDMRLGISTSYNDVINNRLALDYRGHISMEFDYLSMGMGIGGSYDLNNRNTSLLFSYDYEYNRVHPVGNIPIPLASMQPPGAQQPRDVAAATKRIDGFGIGINQIISPTSLLQVKYASSHASGYLSDPYKLVSIVDASRGSTLDYIFESRPGSRNMESIYLAGKMYLGGDVLDLSYRYYWDEWDIKSNTIEARYRIGFDDGKFFQPKLRYYTQDQASFFAHSLPNNIATPQHVSADFRMAEFEAYTLGFKYGKQNSEGKEHSISVEYYTQIGDSHPSDAIGLQRDQDLFPTLQTLVVFYQYGFNW